MTTYRGNQVYVHVLKWPFNNVISLPAFPVEIRGAHGLAGGNLAVVQSASGVRITLPESMQNATDSIVVLELSKAIKS